jgi:hypothetical protein
MSFEEEQELTDLCIEFLDLLIVVHKLNITVIIHSLNFIKIIFKLCMNI